MKTWTQFLGAGLIATLLSTAASAAVFIGSHADITDFAGGTEVSTRGTLVDAVNLLNANVDGVGVSTTINGVLFKGTAPGQFHEGGEDFANASFVYHGGENYSDDSLWSLGGAYETLARSQIYNVDNGNINVGDGFGVVNLSPGVLYELQVFFFDDRDGIVKNNQTLQVQQAQFTGNADELVDQGTGGQEIGYFEGISINGIDDQGEIATVVFTIDETFNGLLVNTWNDGAFAGMQLRTVSLPGDLDADNDVDGRDFLEWQRGFGNPYTEADLADIQAFYGTNLNAPLTANVSAIPEPSTVLLSVLAIGAAAFRRGSWFGRA